MRQLILLCMILFPTIQVHAQADNGITPIPSQVMQLGRGTAETLDWHPDGNVLAVGGRRGLWFYDDLLADLAYFEEVGEVTKLAWSPTGNFIATIDRDNTFRVWSVSLQPYRLILDQSWLLDNRGEYAGWYFAWAPDGEKLAVITATGADVFDVMTGKIVLSIPDMDYAVTWHPDGTQIAGVVDLGEEIGKQVRVWDSTNGAIVITYMSADPYLFWSDIQWSPDGSVLVGITSIPATLHAWDAETGDLLNDVDTFTGEFSAYFNMWWLDAGQQLVTLSRNVSSTTNSNLDVWNTETWTPIDRGFSFDNVRSIAKRPNADELVVLTWDSQIITWELGQTEPLQILSGHSQPSHILAWSDDNQYLATARRLSETLQIWHLSEPTETQSIINPYPWLDIEALYWSENGRTLRAVLNHSLFTAPGTQVTGFVVEWDAQSSETADVIQETAGYIAHDGSGNYLPRNVWSDDFTRVATIVDDEPISLSSVKISDNGGIYIDEVIASVEVVDDPTKLIWSPDNTMIAVITRDSQGETSAWVYDAQTGNLINRLRPSFFVNLYDISWRPDSSMVALVGRRDIAGSGETEYRLDILKIDPSSDEAAYVTSVLDNNTTFYHAWHPESQSIAVTTSSGITISSIQAIPMGVEAVPIVIIPDVQVFALAWSPDGKWLAGSHEDGTVRIWDVVQIHD